MNSKFYKLMTALRDATREHYGRLVAGSPSEQFYGYCLYTNDDVSSIGPVANRESALQVDPNHGTYNYYRFGPQEWSDWDDFGLFEDANQILKSLYEGMDFDNFRAGSLQAALQALTELEAEGLFGPRSDSRYVTLWLSDSSDAIMSHAVKALNNEPVYERYAAEYA
ncbi:MAG TPA: DUF4303 domain-containing protein [Burkholderiaceae bacterium]|jgi:hypothetical protein